MVRLLQRCEQLLRSACQAADAGAAYSPSGMAGWMLAARELGSGAHQRGVLLVAPHPARRELGPRIPLALAAAPSWAAAVPFCARGLFGATKASAPNPQIHTHDKYKQDNPQPTYDWMHGRFVVDRNGVVWHRQAGYRHKRHVKSASRLTRLKRWKPLYGAYASKLLKLGFRDRYWAAPEPREVPGFAESPAPRTRRRSADPDLHPTTGDPSLRQSWVPPARTRLR